MYPCSPKTTGRRWWISSLLLGVGVMIASGSAAAQVEALTLPVYRLDIDPAYLNRLEQDPWADASYPAVFSYDTLHYRCTVRFRGASSRELQKKSWRVAFEDDDNVFEARVITLNAEYRDRSFLRNHLAMALYRYLGHPTPMTRHVNLVVNDQYRGVHLQVERIDEGFLDRHDLESGLLFKTVTNGGNLVPLDDARTYRQTWEKKIGGRRAWTELRALFSRLTFWTRDEFVRLAPEVLDVEAVLTYFAVAQAISNGDGLNKNFYLYRRPDTERFEIFPWDNDATFGNDWQGEYVVDRERWSLRARHTMLFQRLREHPAWEAVFQERITRIRDEGFAYLHTELERTVAAIRHDVYLDPQKRGTNAEFDQAVTQLHHYLDRRTIALQVQRTPTFVTLHRLEASTAFPTPDSTVILRLKAEHLPPNTPLQLVIEPDPGVPAIALPQDQLTLHAVSGDGIYTARLDVPSTFRGRIALTFSYPYLEHETNGLFYTNPLYTLSYALHATGQPEQAYRRLRLGPVVEVGKTQRITLVNPDTVALDVSGCYLQGRTVAMRLNLPPGTRIAAGDTLVIGISGDVEEFPFRVEDGDSLKLLSPMLIPLVETVAVVKRGASSVRQEVVINEINYHASPLADAEDWIELYNPTTLMVDLSGWYVQDDPEETGYTIPPGTWIPPDHYLVLSRDTVRFRAFYPHVRGLVGNLDFGLAGGGDHVRLFDAFGRLVDEVAYDDRSPWPEAADGDGATLELIDPSGDNARPEAWAASHRLGGTPGRRNSVRPYDPSDGELGTLDPVVLGPPYPHPFSTETLISYRMDRPGTVELRVYDLTGRLVQHINVGQQAIGNHGLHWNASGLSAGVYLYQLSLDGQRLPARRAVVVR